MPIAVIKALLQLLQLGLEISPQLVSASQTALSIVETNETPTAEQRAQIETALHTAHAALQAAMPV
jgi:hypothetical protein